MRDTEVDIDRRRRRRKAGRPAGDSDDEGVEKEGGAVRYDAVGKEGSVDGASEAGSEGSGTRYDSLGRRIRKRQTSGSSARSRSSSSPRSTPVSIL